MKTTGKPINRHVASIRQALPPVMPAKSDKTKDVPEPTADQRTVFDKNLAHNRQKALLGEDYGPRKAPGPAVCSLEAADRVLPTLQEAVADPLFSMLAPNDIPVPDDVVKALAGGKRVLVVGHTPPDGDCVGSALGLKRGLEALGKEVDAVVDSDLPGNLRTLGDAGELKKANALGDEPYDLVVLVDVANAKRIGNAADFLPKAKAVLALDHHHETPTHEGLGISDDVKLTTWIETSAESATYLVAGALDKTAKALGADLSDA